MSKKIFLITLILSIIVVIFAQDNNTVKYDQKSVKKAMLLSSLFPGAGQFYADKSSITTYIFPIIEIGLWTGYIYYHNKGMETEEDYEDFADEHYNRAYQNFAQNTIINDPDHFDNGFYNNHFRLDETNTQHFYEDIGKYPKYMYGWTDWFDIYATNGQGIEDPDNWVTPNWYWVADSVGVEKVYGLIEPNNPNSTYYVGNEYLYDAKNGLYSDYKNTYIEMRRDAENYYDKGRNFSFGILANHVLAALDAIRLAKKHNRQFEQQNSLQFKISPIYINDQPSLALYFSKRF
jgi:hypothetical protein